MKRCFRNWEFVCHVAISQSDFIFVLVAGEPVQVIKLDRDGYIIRRVALKETAPFDSRPSFLLCSAHIIVAIDNGLQATSQRFGAGNVLSRFPVENQGTPVGFDC